MKHILIVDDVTTNLKSAAEVLQPYYQLSMAKSGKQALNFLKKSRPDLILLDIMMPEMDGYMTMEQIKLNSRTADIPVIFLTADTEYSSELKGIQMGAMDFITKPFEADVMLSRIEKVLQMEDVRKRIVDNTQKDFLTNLWNFDYMSAEIERLLRNESIEGSMILLDLDDFKAFSDSYGHSVANGVIARFAKALKDLAFTDSLLGRTGEDEFLLYYPKALSESEILTMCEELGGFPLQEANLASGGKHTFTVSRAVVKIGTDGKDFDTLYRKLQMAMYHIKKSGKNNVHFYSR